MANLDEKTASGELFSVVLQAMRWVMRLNSQTKRLSLPNTEAQVLPAMITPFTAARR